MRDDAWSSKWIAEKVLKHEKVVSATSCAANKVTLTLRNGRIVNIATMSSPRLGK